MQTLHHSSDARSSERNLKSSLTKTPHQRDNRQDKRHRLSTVSSMDDPCAHGIRVDAFGTNEGTYSQGAIPSRGDFIGTHTGHHGEGLEGSMQAHKKYRKERKCRGREGGYPIKKKCLLEYPRMCYTIFFFFFFFFCFLLHRCRFNYTKNTTFQTWGWGLFLPPFPLFPFPRIHKNRGEKEREGGTVGGVLWILFFLPFFESISVDTRGCTSLFFFAFFF